MEKECNGIFGKLFGHNMKPRFSLSAPAIETIDYSGSRASLLALVEQSREKRYDLDICTRCGLVVRKD